MPWVSVKPSTQWRPASQTAWQDRTGPDGRAVLSGPKTNPSPPRMRKARQYRLGKGFTVIFLAGGRRSPRSGRARLGGLRLSRKGTEGAGPGRAGRGRLTVAVGLVRAVLAVRLAVAAQAQVHALAPGTGELGGRAHRAALLVALVVTLGEAVAAPGPRDAVNLPGGASELVGGARGRLCGGAETPSHAALPGDAKTRRCAPGCHGRGHAALASVVPTVSRPCPVRHPPSCPKVTMAGLINTC